MLTQEQEAKIKSVLGIIQQLLKKTLMEDHQPGTPGWLALRREVHSHAASLLAELGKEKDDETESLKVLRFLHERAEKDIDPRWQWVCTKRRVVVRRKVLEEGDGHWEYDGVPQ